MPRPRRLTQMSSQASQSQYLEDNSEELLCTQDKEKATAEAANLLVQYILHHMDNSKLLRLQTMKKFTAVKGVRFNKQIDAANIILKNVYGCELEICDDPYVKVPAYYINKLTPNIQFPVQKEDRQVEKTVTFWIMAMLYMLKGKCSERAMLEYMIKLKAIDNGDEGIDENEYMQILKELHNKRMIILDKEQLEWGPLSDNIVNKLAILEFVSKLYKTSLDSWGDLYTDAMNQKELNNNNDEEAEEQE